MSPNHFIQQNFSLGNGAFAQKIKTITDIETYMFLGWGYFPVLTFPTQQEMVCFN